jgi:hypothetical protein
VSPSRLRLITAHAPRAKSRIRIPRPAAQPPPESSRAVDQANSRKGSNGKPVLAPPQVPSLKSQVHSPKPQAQRPPPKSMKSEAPGFRP